MVTLRKYIIIDHQTLSFGATKGSSPPDHRTEAGCPQPRVVPLKAHVICVMYKLKGRHRRSGSMVGRMGLAGDGIMVV